MFLVVRKSSVKRTLALAMLLIVVGMSIVTPIKTQAQSNLVYLYPTEENNPVETIGLFWWEDYPELGAYPLPEWDKAFPGKQIVIGVPDHMEMGAFVGDNIGKYIVAKIDKRKQNKGPYTKNDVFVYKRSITNTQINEEIRIEIGKHFSDNDNFEKFIEIVRDSLTDPEIIQQPPPPQEQSPDTTNALLFGNTMILSGLALLVRILMFAL